MRLFLLLLVLAAAGSASATLTFPTRAAAVANVTAYVRQHSALRLALAHGAVGGAALTPYEMDTLLVERLHLIVSDASAAGAADEDDVRQRYEPAAWRAEPLITYVNGVGSAGVTAVNATVARTTAPPPEIIQIMAALLTFTTVLSDDQLCPNANDVPVIDPVTKQVAQCGCQDGRTCAMTTVQGGGSVAILSLTTAENLPRVVAMVAAVVIGGLFLGVIIPNTFSLRRFNARFAAVTSSPARL